MQKFRLKLTIALVFFIFLAMNHTTLCQSGTPAECFQSLGYSAIQMTPNIYGHFELNVKLDGKYEITLIVDTGANISLLSKHLLDSLGYETFPVPDTEGRTFYRTRIDSLVFGNANTGRREMFAGKLEELFPGFSLYGKRVHGIIGSDLLNRYSAIIEVPFSRLFLKIH
ncbi:MAG: aspartyl protease family protein [Bacteroidota bacterium]|jgi:hypothetical protein